MSEGNPTASEIWEIASKSAEFHREKSQITTQLERDLLSLLFDPKYADMTLDQIRTMASGYVYPENRQATEEVGFCGEV